MIPYIFSNVEKLYYTTFVIFLKYTRFELCQKTIVITSMNSYNSWIDIFSGRPIGIGADSKHEMTSSFVTEYFHRHNTWNIFPFFFSETMNSSIKKNVIKNPLITLNIPGNRIQKVVL